MPGHIYSSKSMCYFVDLFNSMHFKAGTYVIDVTFNGQQVHGEFFSRIVATLPQLRAQNHRVFASINRNSQRRTLIPTSAD
jgi:hypothetical protein